ncbi:hypothetical protein LV779_37630 [Streptomyces thinghirensis]|nr:hypothetical protein [Streptomyces thinghirensis]
MPKAYKVIADDLNAARNRRVVIVTAVHGPSAHFLPEAYASPVRAGAFRRLGWRWVIQEDGQTDDVRPYVPDDPRVVFRQGRPGQRGGGCGPTMALSPRRRRVREDPGRRRPAPPGALARDLAALETGPALGWATSRALDLLPDGSTAGFPGDPDHGPIERGAVLDHWKANDYRAQVTRRRSWYGANCCSRSVAGWPCRRPRTPACCWRSTA